MSTLSARLKQIRILNHYSMEEVAQRIGVTKQSISKYEAGSTLPAAEILTKLIDFYELPAGYLAKPERAGETCSPLFYRKNNRTSQREMEAVQICIMWYYEMLIACRQISDMSIPNLPYLGINLSIEEKVQALRTHWGIPYGPVKNLAELLSRNGIYIFTAVLENKRIDGYSQIIDDYPIIVLNQSKGSRARKNFSLAHEVGHLILHCGEENSDLTVMEDEADEFAACFLMPEKELREEMVHVDADNLDKLANKWGVSPQAILERCWKLGMLGEGEIGQARRQYLLQRLNGIKNFYVPEEEDICSIKALIQSIDSDALKRETFMREARFPLPMMRKLLQMPDLFEQWKGSADSADELEGVQLTFAF